MKIASGKVAVVPASEDNANPAPNGRPLSQSRWTSSANRCSTDRTVHGKLEIEFTGPDKLLG